MVELHRYEGEHASPKFDTTVGYVVDKKTCISRYIILFQGDVSSLLLVSSCGRSRPHTYLPSCRVIKEVYITRNDYSQGCHKWKCAVSILLAAVA